MMSSLKRKKQSLDFRSGWLHAALLATWLALPTPAHADSRGSAWVSSTGRTYENPRFRLDLPVTATVTLDLMSSVDTYLYLLNQDGSQLIARDDDSGDGLNSRLTVTLGAGKYMLVAATYSPGQRGDFTLSSSQGWLSYCFTAYEHFNYGGASNTFCEGGSQPFRNDQYSSLRVPKGMRVRAFEHGGGVGLARTYFQDVPNVGPLYNDMISSFWWSDFQVNDFFMVFASDPQFSWKHCNDGAGPLCDRENQAFAGWSDEDLARYYNTNVVNGINWVKNQLGEHRFGGTVVNGDLTEFGKQDVDLGDYVNIWEHGVQSNVYLGLGNHDYDNNVNDCYENQCATGMVWYFKDQVWTLNAGSFDYSESGVYYEFPSNRKNHSGSLGYSWDIGNVHFVQLNNYPTYARDWNGWNFSEARRDYFYISSAIAWLRNDLQAAASSGKKLVLNMHDWGNHGASAEVIAAINDFPVSVVYAGHWHGVFGQNHTVWTNSGRAVPVFLSGSAHLGTFLVTRFVNNKMYTWLMAADQFNGGRLRVQYNGNSYDAATTGGLFDVCAGCSRYYQYEHDLR